ncbi:DUF4411 family protein [Bradyrhizobium sp. URHA0013]|jgi:hypothetical protein|uniref:DUF4411 family protein n=1 Tax=Bradyrhizobium sp. URHA0013 TaxID=1380352 RepID=UPI0004812D64|nr:DUF4411 family protein [Bradyrhizobium sp. URHA0013]
MPKPYCLDSNIFIQAQQGPYAMDIVPGFWKWLDKESDAGRIISCRTVYEEMVGFGDELATWVKDRDGSPFFMPPDAAVQGAFGPIAGYVVNTYPQHNASEFLKGADPWLIARAQTHGMIVATGEQLVDPTSTKPKIPNVCKQFGVEYMGPYEMLRQLGAKFDM